MRNSTVFILVFVFALAPLSVRGQNPPPQPEQDEEKILVGTNEVMLDAVVRDKKGRTIKDLTLSDFEIYEDGVRQDPQSFRLVTRAPGSMTAGQPPSPPAAIGSTGPTERPTTPTLGNLASGIGAVAIVFDRLSPDARARARQAALTYLNEGLQPNDFVGVFNIDLSLHILQPLTNNVQLVRQAVEGAAGHSPSLYTSSAAQVRGIQQNQVGVDQNIAASEAAIAQAASSRGQGGQSGAGSLGANMAQQAFNQMNELMLQTFERLERDQQGYATTDGLLAIVNALSRLPGRKAIIFFSEGIAIPPAVLAHFRSVISNANRAGVSVYAVDAGSLRVESPNAETQREVSSLGARRLRQVATGLEDTSGQPMSRMLERNEDLLRLNPHSGLGQLADETGGFLISETNAPGDRLRQLNEDLHSYYALTYIPKNQTYDGRFRQITLKVKRPEVEVQARRGYYAVPPNLSAPVLAYEAPALAVLSGQPHAGSIPVHTAVFNFPESNKLTLAPVLIEVPSSAFSYELDNERKLYHSDFTIVALVKDGALRVVRKLSKQYQLSGPAEQVATAKRDTVLFYRETELPPGRYTVVAAAYDMATGQAGVGSSSFEVGEALSGNLRLSSLVVVKRVERLSAEERQATNPFHFGEALVYPVIDEPLHKSANQPLTFFVTLYTKQGAQTSPKLTVELMQRGRTLGRATLNDLPAPDASGRIQYASALPLTQLQPGEYELKVTAIDGQESISRTGRFTLAP